MLLHRASEYVTLSEISQSVTEEQIAHDCLYTVPRVVGLPGRKQPGAGSELCHEKGFKVVWIKGFGNSAVRAAEQYEHLTLVKANITECLKAVLAAMLTLYITAVIPYTF